MGGGNRERRPANESDSRKKSAETSGDGEAVDTLSLESLEGRIARLGQRLERQFRQAAVDLVRHHAESGMVDADDAEHRPDPAVEALRLRLAQLRSSLVGMLEHVVVARPAASECRGELDGIDRQAWILESLFERLPGPAPLRETALQGMADMLTSLEARLRAAERPFGLVLLHEERLGLLVEEIHRFEAGHDCRPSRLRQLAQSILEEVDQEEWTRTESERTSDPVRQIAIHGLNTARTVAFLTSGDLQWIPKREEMVVASLLMDVGMRGLGRALVEGRPLNEDERRRLRVHPPAGAILLEMTGEFDSAIARAASMHHERLDGTGYPKGLSGADLPNEARLFAVADVFTALRETRAYRPAATTKAAIRWVLHEVEAGRLDGDWAARLLNLSLYPPGTFVELARGEIAESIAPQQTGGDWSLAALPIVRVYRLGNGRTPTHPLIWNLAQRPDCQIVRQLAPSEVEELLQHEN